MDTHKVIDSDGTHITKGTWLHCHDCKRVLEDDPKIRHYVGNLKVVELDEEDHG